MTPSPQPGRDGQHRWETVLRARVVAVDLALIAVTLGVLVALGVGASAPLSLDTPRLFVVTALAVLWPLMLWELETRSGTVLGAGPEEYRRVLIASAWTVCFAAAAAYAMGFSRARDFLLWAGVLGSALLFSGRNVMRRVVHHRIAKGHPLHRVFIVAPNSQEGMIVDQLERSSGVFAEVGRWALGDGVDPEPAIVVKAALDARADTLLYAPGSHADPTWPRRLGWAMEDTDLSLLVSPGVAEIAGPRLSIEPVQGLALVRVEMPRFSGPVRVVKRVMDLTGSVLGLALLAVPLALVALAIKLDSPGPVLFRQVRAGAGGTTFQCWKFRTMVAGADAQRAALRASAEPAPNSPESATFKMAEDPRITRFGQLLRRFSLDELPQLFNVLRGDMSLVGPRPHPLDDVERYDDIASRRLLAKPGMTGLWQVSGRSDLSWEDAVMLDLYYVENWSISLDMVIFLRTIKAVLTGRGAY